MISRARRSRRLLAAAAACAALAMAAALSGCAQQASQSAAAAPVQVEQSPGPLDAGALQDPDTEVREQPASSATPTGIRIPAIGVDSALENLAIGADGRLQAPVDYDLAGWYAGGVKPGAVGPAIIAGHIDSPTAPAVFARLGELSAGAEVRVAMSDGTELVFTVTGAIQSAKSAFPTDEVYSNVPAPELRLITCAGSFDSAIGHYTDNLIVFAALRG